ncbi:hypothetical protein C5O80_37540 [Burkholderia sp. SRS-46]|nr:hypothetical protein C5O80_37540 [Burkholderia sp. SRS-46]
MNKPLLVRWSIAHALAVLYTVATLVILSLAGSYLYLALKNELLVRDTATVAHQVRRLRNTIGEATATDTPERWVRRWTEHATGDPRFQSRLVDGSGRIIVQSVDMAVPPTAFPKPAGPDTLPDHGVRWHGAAESKFLLVAGQALSADRQPYTLQVAMDLTDSKQILDGYRHKVAALLVVTGLLAVGLGWFVARRAILPIRRITESIQDANARADPGIEIDSARLPTELHELAVAIDRYLARVARRPPES